MWLVAVMGYTIKRAITLSGIGIHSGKPAILRVKPAMAGRIRFVCQGQTIPLRLSNLKPQNLGTNLTKNGVSIKTIEHLCAVLWSLQLTDLILELEGNEVPIMDGSALELFAMFKKAGRRPTKTLPCVLEIKEPVSLFLGDTYIVALPAKQLSIHYTIEFKNTPIKTQTMMFTSRAHFSNQIMSARTFGNVEDVKQLHANGRALGATLENVLAYNSKEFVNKPRFEDEAVRHKILDLLGDLYASGYDVRGKLIVFKSSHLVNYKFVKKAVKLFGTK